jgi:flagellar hook-basal body complex protein FliE
MQSPVQLNGLQLPKDIEITPRQYEIASGDIENDSFADMLSNAINGVDTTMKTSEAKMQDYIAGRTDNVADVMISMQRAQLSFQMMVEVRNKAIETYNEISRMQI